jgi:hypothetical protein
MQQPSARSSDKIIYQSRGYAIGENRIGYHRGPLHPRPAKT